MSFSEWKEESLGNVASYSSDKVNIREINVHNYVSTENLLPNIGGLDIASSLPTGNKVTKYQKGDILISNIRPYFKKIWLANTNGGCSNDVLVLKVNDNVDKSYLYYNLANDKFFDYVMSGAKGTKMPRGDKQHILKYKMFLPSLEEQKAIAYILSTLDEKIEVNNKINNNLEEMAQTIFKHWCVDFEFPNENGEPYKSSGGEMVESELGMIPKGWVEKPLYNFAKFINGTSFKKDEYSTRGYPIIKIAELKNGITGSTQYFQGVKDEKYFIKNSDILFSWSGNPETSIDTFIWTGGDAILNQHTFKIELINEDYTFIYLLLKFFKPEFTRIASGKQTTGLGHVTVNDLKRLKFQYNRDITLKLCNLVTPILQKYINNLFENQKLSSLRDTLLPKLMSGKIRVPLDQKCEV